MRMKGMLANIFREPLELDLLKFPNIIVEAKQDCKNQPYVQNCFFFKFTFVVSDPEFWA